MARALQVGSGKHLSQANRAGRDPGEMNPTTVCIHRTLEEQQRRGRRAVQEQPRGKGRGDRAGRGCGRGKSRH